MSSVAAEASQKCKLSISSDSLHVVATQQAQFCSVLNSQT